MSKRSIVYGAVLVAVFALGALWGQVAMMSPVQAQDGTTEVPLADTLPAGNPVVACTPHAYMTEMEDDPFDPEKVRRTRTRVTSVVVVYADGSTSTKPVNAR